MIGEEIWVASEKLKSSTWQVGLGFGKAWLFDLQGACRLDSGSVGPSAYNLGALNDVSTLAASSIGLFN